MPSIGFPTLPPCRNNPFILILPYVVEGAGGSRGGGALALELAVNPAQAASHAGRLARPLFAKRGKCSYHF